VRPGRTFFFGAAYIYTLFVKFLSLVLPALLVAATASCGGGGEAPPTVPVPAGITLLAGSLDAAGQVDGPGAIARFSNPSSVAAMADGTLRIADNDNALVRRVALTGDTGTLSYTLAGATTTFQVLGRSVSALAALPGGDFIVSRIFGNSAYDLARVDARGTLRSATFGWAHAMASGPDGTLYFANGNGNQIDRLYPDGTRDILVSGFQSTALAVDAAGNVYSAGFDHAIRRVDPTGVVRIWAGQPGAAGFADGSLSDARFDRIAAMTFDSAGQLYVADATTIRRISVDGQVRLLAGTPGQAQTAFGPLPGSVSGVKGLTWWAGVLYATVGHAVVRISPA
jgi:outer membrane protein assembly factor BamB